MFYYCKYNSPLGELTLYSDGLSLCGLDFFNTHNKSFCAAELKPDLIVFDDTRRWLDLYFNGSAPDFIPQIKLYFASDFRRAVCLEMLKVGYGELITYGKIAENIAKRTGRRTCAQAVGGAVGRNPIGIIIPCHRVIGADMKLTGFSAGIDTKLELLKLEGHDTGRFVLPK